MRHPTPREQSHVLDPDGFSLFVHFFCLVRGVRQGFVTQHVQAGLQRAHRHEIMQVIRRGDDQRLQVAFLNDFSIVGENVRDVIFLSHFFCPVAVPATDSG